MIHEQVTSICRKLDGNACAIFRSAFTDTWKRAIKWYDEDHSVYVITGDIPLMWLRDSAAQVWPYVRFASSSVPVQAMLEGVLRRMMVWVKMDPYGSAFRMDLDFDRVGKKKLTDWDYKCGRTIHIAQHDYEPDSLSYVIRLGYAYWKATGFNTFLETNGSRL